MSRAFLAVLVTVSFMAVRSRIYAARPIERPCAEIQSLIEDTRRGPCRDPRLWLSRDIVMSVPRLAAFAACLIILGWPGFLARS